MALPGEITGSGLIIHHTKYFIFMLLNSMACYTLSGPWYTFQITAFALGHQNKDVHAKIDDDTRTRIIVVPIIMNVSYAT